MRAMTLVRTLLLGGLAVLAQQRPASLQATPPQTAQPQTVTPEHAPPEPETLHVLVGRSIVINSPTRLRRVSIADPTIADAVIVSPTEIVVNGKAPGTVSLVLWDESGQSQSQTFEILVELDVLDLRQKIRKAFPNDPIQVEASKDVLILSGKVSSPAVADRVLELGKASTAKVVSLLEVPTAPAGAEILLQVKFAEVDRSALTQLGINILSLPGAKNVGSISTQQYSPPSLTGGVNTSGATTTTSSDGTTTTSQNGFTLSNLLNIFLVRPDINLAAAIEALQARNVLEILAEPNVLTESGKEASFLAGGEFPFPVIQPSAGGVPLVTIQFRPFGVQLNFAPTLAPDGMIHLKVRPEVSSLDFSNAVTISGFTVPALSTRRVESEMDLQDGQSFAIAGLIDNQVTEQLDKVPGIGDVPILGKLFQSKSTNKSRNELLVVVTPRIVKPSPVAPLPAEPPFPKSFLPPVTAPKTAPAAGGR